MEGRRQHPRGKDPPAVSHPKPRGLRGVHPHLRPGHQADEQIKGPPPRRRFPDRHDGPAPRQAAQHRHTGHDEIAEEGRGDHGERHLPAAAAHRHGADENGPDSQDGDHVHRAGAGARRSERRDGSGVLGHARDGGLRHVGGQQQGQDDSPKVQ